MREVSFYYDAIAFDFDGVLVDSVAIKGRAFHTLYKDYGEKIADSVLSYHSKNGGVSRLEKFRYIHRNYLGLPLSRAEEEDLGYRFSVLVEDAVVGAPYVEGARKFLDAFFEKIPVYVVSGTPETELRRIIARRGMEHYFVAVYGTPASKGDTLRRIAVDRYCSLRRVLMVGDAMTDFYGALAAGSSFIGRVSPNETNPFPPSVRTIPNLTSLAALICG